MADDLSVIDLDTDLTRHFEGIFLFPALRHWRLDPAHPLSTYAFVMLTVPDRVLRLRRSRFVEQVLLTPGGAVARVTDQELARMIRVPPVPDLPTGALVRVVNGDWSGLTGEVTGISGPRAVVRIGLHSLTSDVAMAVSDLQPVGR